MRVITYTRYFCFFIVTLLVAMPVAEAQSNAQKQLRHALSTFLSKQQEILEDGGEARLKRDGKITIEPQDDYYVVTMPHLTLLHDNGRRVDIGILSINARPAGGDNMWDISMAWPTPILVYNKKNLLTARLDIGDQKITGKWHGGYHRFKDIKAHIRDVVLTSHKDSAKLELPEIRIEQQMRANGSPQQWTGTNRVMMKNPSVLTNKGHKLVHIGKAGLNIKLDAHSPKRLQTFRSEWLNLIEGPQNGGEYTDKALALYDLIAKKLLQVQNGVDVTTYAENVRIQPTQTIRRQSKKADIKAIKLARLQYSFGYSDIRSNKAGLDTGFTLKGTNITPKPDIAKGLTPEDMRIHYAVKNLPYKTLVNFGRKQISQQIAGKTGSRGKSAKQQAMQAIPGMLMDAGTQLEMKNNYIHAGDYKANIDAILKADTEAAMNFTLDSQARIKGLQGLIATLKTRAKNSENPMIAGNLKKAIGILTTVHMLGQQGKKGQDSRVYNIMVNKAGKAMLNGSNLSNLMQAFGRNSRGNSNDDQGNTAIPQGMPQ